MVENNHKKRRSHQLQIFEKMKLLLALFLLLTIFRLVLLPAMATFLSLLKPLIVKKIWDALMFLAIITAIFVCITQITSEEIPQHKHKRSVEDSTSNSTSDSGVRADKEIREGDFNVSSSSSTYRLRRSTEQHYDKHWNQYAEHDGYSLDPMKPCSSSLDVQNKLVTSPVNEKMMMDKTFEKQNPNLPGSAKDPGSTMKTGKPMILREDPIHETDNIRTPKHIEPKMAPVNPVNEKMMMDKALKKKKFIASSSAKDPKTLIETRQPIILKEDPIQDTGNIRTPELMEAKMAPVAQPQAIDRINKENGSSKEKPHKTKEDSHHNIPTDYNSRSLGLIGSRRGLQQPDGKMKGLLKSSRLSTDDDTDVMRDGNLGLGASANYRHRNSALRDSSKHSASALNLAEFNELIEGKVNRSGRRKTSQSYDFDCNDEWAFKEPPPPPMDLLEGIAGPHSTLEDLLPWRTNRSSTVFDSSNMPSRRAAECEDTTTDSTSDEASPQLYRSPSELNRKVSEYIDKVYSDLLRQRQSSFKRRKEDSGRQLNL